jgi:hypothetical protein
LSGPGQGVEESVLESLQNWGWWALSPDGIFFEEEPSTAKAHLKFLGLTSKQVSDLRTLEYPVNPNCRTITVSPDGHRVVYQQFENWGSNIVLIENFR